MGRSKQQKQPGKPSTGQTSSPITASEVTTQSTMASPLERFGSNSANQLNYIDDAIADYDETPKNEVPKIGEYTITGRFRSSSTSDVFLGF